MRLAPSFVLWKSLYKIGDISFLHVFWNSPVKLSGTEVSFEARFVFMNASSLIAKDLLFSNSFLLHFAN